MLSGKSHSKDLSDPTATFPSLTPASLRPPGRRLNNVCHSDPFEAYLNNVVVGKVVLALPERLGWGRRELPEGPRAEYPHGATRVEGGLEFGLGTALSLLVRSPLVFEQQLPLRPPFGLSDSTPFPISGYCDASSTTSWRRRMRSQEDMEGGKQRTDVFPSYLSLLFDTCVSHFVLKHLKCS